MKKLANNYLTFYKDLKNKKTKSWIHEKTESSIQELKRIIDQINEDLHPNKVELYCKPLPNFEKITLGDINAKGKDNSNERKNINEYFNELFEQTNTYTSLFEIIRLAPEQNIIHDITWLTDGYINDYIEIALGKKKIEFFESFLLSKIEDTEKRLIPFFENIAGFSEKIKIIKEAINHSKKDDFLISNILLITVTESIVRDTCKFIYEYQNPSCTKERVEEFIYNQFVSLETLLAKGNWQNDYPIQLIDAILAYKDVSETNINNWRTKFYKHRNATKTIKAIVNEFTETFKTLGASDEEIVRKVIEEYLGKLKNISTDLLLEEDFNIKINISIMLHFLIRKYKDDRNLIIHGNFETLNHKWKNYINYSALLKVYEVYKNYKDFYSEIMESNKSIASIGSDTAHHQ